MVVILLENARIYRHDPQSGRFIAHRTLLIDEGRIIALDCDPPSGTRRCDLQGATVLPAFTDSHVHLAATGYSSGERNLAEVRSYADFDAAITRIAPDDGTIYAAQFDDAQWSDGRTADAFPLERHHAGRRAMAVRVDGHSCLVNAATLSWLDLPREMPGIERNDDGIPTGRLFREANWRAQGAFIGAFSNQTVRRAERRAVEMAIRNGIVHLHAQLLGRDRDGYREDVVALRALPANVYPKICEPDPDLARELGLRAVGGDVFLDGSIGSCTAAVSAPYRDSDDCGALRFDDEELLRYFSRAEELGIAAGVHAIGDAAIDQCIRTWERVLQGMPSRTGARHFIEHFEMASDEHISASARMGLMLSMQPQFDASWGGERRMYEARLGGARMKTMNRFATIVRAGGTVCGGSDSPVCRLDALAGMQACLDHHQLDERLDPHTALALYTVHAAHLGYAEQMTGNIEPGLAADLVILDRDPLNDRCDGAPFGEARVVQTWRAGALVYDAVDGHTCGADRP